MSQFTKLAADGQELAADATDHVAVRDNTTGLIWSAATLTDGEVDHAQAEKVAAECRLLDADDWRLPTVEELFCLADRSRYAPAIDTDFFPDTRSDSYWSSSAFAADSDFAWVVFFRYGFADGCPRVYGDGFVRAVRGAPASQ